jgi:hypothetical protein
MDVFEQLRQRFDGSDPFVAGGHAVRGGGMTRNADRVANTPEWANDNLQVRELLLKVFPKLATDENQRKRALAWATIIYLYHRCGMTQLHISMRLGWTENRVKMMIRNINRAATGRSVRTGKPRGKRGRPRKNSDTLLATSGNTF